MFLVSACTSLCPIHWSQLSSREYDDLDVDVVQIYCPLRCYYIIGLAVYYSGCRVCLPTRWMYCSRLLSFAMCFVTKPLYVKKGMASFPPPVWLLVNPLWPSDAICRHSAWFQLSQVMAWCLTTRSRQLVQCWLLINTVLWQSTGNNVRTSTQAISLYSEFEN